MFNSSSSSEEERLLLVNSGGGGGGGTPKLGATPRGGGGGGGGGGGSTKKNLRLAGVSTCAVIMWAAVFLGGTALGYIVTWELDWGIISFSADDSSPASPRHRSLDDDSFDPGAPVSRANGPNEKTTLI